MFFTEEKKNREVLILCQNRAVLVGTRWCWVSGRWYWLVLGGTGSLQGGTGSNITVLGQYGAVLVGTWW